MHYLFHFTLYSRKKKLMYFLQETKAHYIGFHKNIEQHELRNISQKNTFYSGKKSSNTLLATKGTIFNCLIIYLPDKRAWSTHFMIVINWNESTVRKG